MASTTFNTAVQGLLTSLGNVYEHMKEATFSVIEKAHLKPLAKQVDDFVKKYPDLLFWGTHAVNAFYGFGAFTTGFLIGLGTQLTYKTGLSELNIRVVKSDDEKVDFAACSTISQIFLKTFAISAVSGFVAGNYFGNLGLVNDPKKAFRDLRDRVEDAVIG